MSVDISALLRDLADRSEPTRLADPDDVRRLGDRRARRQQVQLVVGLALAVTIAVMLSRGLFDRGAVPQPVRPVPAPTTPTATSTTATDAAGQTTHAIETGPYRFSAHAIAMHAGRFVVVGDSSDFDTSGPAVYWSDDAVHWRAPIAPGLPRSDNVTDVIATDSGFLAVGVDARGPAAWRSVNGLTWVPSHVAAQRASGTDALWGVTHTRLGYFTWGFDSGHAALWRSGDGVTWAPVGDGGVFDLPKSESICAVRETAGGLAAFGVVAPRNSREGRRVVWSSPDGSNWVLSQRDGQPMLWCDPPQVLGHLQASDPAVGQVDIEPNGEGDEVYVTTR